MKIYKAADDLGLKEYVSEHYANCLSKYFVNALEPPAFKKRVQSALALGSNKGLKKDPVKLYGMVREELRHFLEYVPQDLWKLCRGSPRHFFGG
jgi:hypothetical protein